MLRTKSLLFLVLFGFGIQAIASGGGNIQRGGLGFLFPDNNALVNPGQWSDSRGMAVEAFYGRTTATGGNQSLTPSFVYGNGSMGFGAYATRVGADLTAPLADTVGAGLGVALMKGRASLGVRYDKVVGITDNGSVTGTLTLNPPNRKGVALGVGYTRDITAGSQSLTAGLGYSFMSNSNMELNVRFPSLSSASDFDLTACFTAMSNMLYLGGAYLMQKTTATTSHGVQGRLGFILGRSVDLSAWAQNYFVTGSSVSYGGSFRASF